MKKPAKPTLNPSGINKEFYVSVAKVASTDGCPIEININASVANIAPHCEAEPYYTAPNFPIITGILA